MAYLFLEASYEGSVQYTGCLNGEQCNGTVEKENDGDERPTRFGPVQRVVWRLAGNWEAKNVAIRCN